MQNATGAVAVVSANRVLHTLTYGVRGRKVRKPVTADTALAADIGVSSGARFETMAANDLAGLIRTVTQMHQAASAIHVELAARLRDELGDLKKEMRQMIPPRPSEADEVTCCPS